MGNYTEQDIHEGTRAFTGWTNDVLEFKFDAGQHDFGEKTFLGQTGPFDGGDIIRIMRMYVQWGCQMKILGLFLSIMALAASASADICNANWLAAADGFDVTAFINAGMDPNGRCANHPIDNRPLHQALLTPGVDVSVIRVLVEAGADARIRNLEGDNPITLALERFERASSRLAPGSAAYRREEAIRMIVLRGFEDAVDALNDAHDKLCDLDWWRSSASEAAVQELLSVPRVDVDHVCNSHNDRPIQIPLKLVSFAILPENVFWGIKALVDGGANLTVRNNSGESAESLAGIRYDQVHRRLTSAQIRWCRAEGRENAITVQQSNNEIARNRFDKSIYQYITSVIREESYEQAEGRVAMELFGTTSTEGMGKDVICPHLGIFNYKLWSSFSGFRREIRVLG